jgi:methylmalonyl-CoA mutase cobalamin-binding subunit
MAEAGPDAPLLELVERLFGLLSQYQVQALDLELGKLAVLLSPSALVHQVVLPLLFRVGEGWAHGLLNVAQEHLLSFSLRRILFLLTPPTRGSAPAKPLVFATPSGQRHEFGLLAAAMLATTHNFQVINVGVEVPCADLIEVVTKTKAQGLILGLREPFHEADFWQGCQHLVRQLPNTPILAGGPLTPDCKSRLIGLGIEILDTLRQLEHRFAHW